MQGTSQKVARTHPKHAPRARSEMSNPWEDVDQPIALPTVMRPRGLVFFAGPTISRATRKLLDFVSLPSKNVGLLGFVSDDSERESDQSDPSIGHPAGVSEYT